MALPIEILVSVHLTVAPWFSLQGRASFGKVEKG